MTTTPLPGGTSGSTGHGSPGAAAAAAEGEATITAYRDGPLIVRGDFRIVDHDGTEIDPDRSTVALCRCGRSALKPFCDGSHKPARFRSGESTHRRPPEEPCTAGSNG